MNDLEAQNTTVCPSCGHPAHAGHASDCPRVKEETDLRAGVDLRTVDNGKFIYPSAAEGPGIHELQAGDVRIPVSFTIKEGRFRLNGVQEGTNNGAIISGVFSGDQVAINHIDFAEELRRTGLSKTILSDLEKLLQDQQVKTAYASFMIPGTVDFFLKNGYEIVSFSSLENEQKRRLALDAKDFDLRVNNAADYQALKETPNNEFRKILMVKKISDEEKTELLPDLESQERNKLFEQTVTSNLNSPKFLERLRKVSHPATAIGVALHYHCLHPDGFNFDGFTQYMDDGVFKDFASLQDEIVSSVTRKLALQPPENDEQREAQEQQIYDYVVKNFIQNGYVFHGFNGTFEKQIRINGLKTSERMWDYAEIDRAKALVEKTGNYLFHAIGHSRNSTYYCTQERLPYEYAISSPEWFSILAQDNHIVPNEYKSRTAFYRRDYETAMGNFENFCNTQKARGSIDENEKQELLDFFKKYWDILMGPESKPKDALIRRAATGKDDIETHVHPQLLKPKLEFKRAMRELLKIATGKNNSGTEIAIKPSDIAIVDLPDYTDVGREGDITID